MALTSEEAEKLGALNATDKSRLDTFSKHCSEPVKFKSAMASVRNAEGENIITAEGAAAYVEALCNGIKSKTDEQHTANPSHPKQTPPCTKSAKGCEI